MPDPWGVATPPAVDAGTVPPLPDRLADLAALTGRRPLGPDETWTWPGAAELPEVRALAPDGWRPLEPAPLHWCLPAVWPADHRCWVPDRLPRISVASDGDRQWLHPTDPGRGDLTEDLATAASECGLPAPPPGRLWLLRSPWPSLGLDVVLLLVARHREQRDLRDTWVGFTAAARELLTWPEDRIWTWWDGPEHAAALSWRHRGETGEQVADLVRAGLGPTDLATLTRPADPGAGLSREQAVAWCEAVGEVGGAAVERIRDWRAAGLPAEPPRHVSWLLHQITPEELAAWSGTGFAVEDVARLAGLPLEVAVAWRAAGFPAVEVERLLSADPTLTPVEAAAFDAAGVAPGDRVRWVEAGFDAAAARAWTGLDVLPGEARVWRSVGHRPADAARLRAEGAGPLPPGVHVGWSATGGNTRANRRYGVTDPPGTRGRTAGQESRRRPYLPPPDGNSGSDT